MTREHFERLCFGDYGEPPIVRLANPADEKLFTRTKRRTFFVVDEPQQFYELTIDPCSMYFGGLTHDDFYLMFEPGMKLRSAIMSFGEESGPATVGTIVSVDTKRGVLTMIRDTPTTHPADSAASKLAGTADTPPPARAPHAP